MKDKNSFRKTAYENRNLLSEEEISEGSSIIAHKILKLPEIADAENIFCYLSSKEKKEISTDLLIYELFKKNKKIYIPKTDWKNRNTIIYALDSFPLKEDNFKIKFGIPEPIDEYFREYSGANLDVLIIPGLACDPNGNRYGYGGGFFDKLLSRIKQINNNFITVFALFSKQLFPSLPAEEHDYPVDIIVTEKEVIYTPNYKRKADQ